MSKKLSFTRIIFRIIDEIIKQDINNITDTDNKEEQIKLLFKDKYKSVITNNKKLYSLLIKEKELVEKIITETFKNKFTYDKLLNRFYQKDKDTRIFRIRKRLYKKYQSMFPNIFSELKIKIINNQIKQNKNIVNT